MHLEAPVRSEAAPTGICDTVRKGFGNSRQAPKVFKFDGFSYVV